MLISILSAFGTGRETAMRALGWSSIAPNELRRIQGVLEAQIDAMN